MDREEGEKMYQLVARAGVLIEALPYIQRFAGKTFVIKCGGQTMESQDLKESVALNITLLKYIGINPIILHGGGEEVLRLMGKGGLKPGFAAGRPVTDKETMELLEMVLVGKVNRDFVSLFNNQGGKAVGLSGKDARLFLGEKQPPAQVEGEKGPVTVDFGYTGDITRVNPELVNLLSREGYIPVIASVGVTEEGEALNIDADHAAGHLAAALAAEKLILLTDQEGILRDPGNSRSLISVLPEAEARALLASGSIGGGMAPKVEACLRALKGGVNRTHIINGSIPHSLLLEVFTDSGIGTMVTGKAG